MENMDKGLAVLKWVLINCSKIPQMPENLPAQIVCPSPKVLDFNEKRLQWASVVRGQNEDICRTNVDAQQRKMKRLNFIALLPPCLLQSLAVGFSTCFLTKEN
jgi:hypothetical protein